MDKIFLHYDMDAFFASVEQRDNLEYRNKPIAVGYGVVTTASYEARKYGVKSGMIAMEAKKLCPSLKFVPARKGIYEKVGNKIQKLVLKITNECEFTSIDEGYIEITNLVKKYDNIEEFIKKFKLYIYKNTLLTCSVGIGYSKISAKIASDINKPNGHYIFKNREEFLKYIKNKNLSVIPGIGRKTREILEKYKITKVFQLYKFERAKLKEKFGEVRGNYLYDVIRGVHNSNIENNRETHSYGYEITFGQPMNDENAVLDVIKKQVYKLCERLKKNRQYAKTITVKIRYSNFTTYTKSKTIHISTRDFNEIYLIAKENYMQMYKRDEVRLIGVHVGSITNSRLIQLTFNDMLT